MHLKKNNILLHVNKPKKTHKAVKQNSYLYNIYSILYGGNQTPSLGCRWRNKISSGISVQK